MASVGNSAIHKVRFVSTMHGVVNGAVLEVVYDVVVHGWVWFTSIRLGFGGIALRLP